jgi:hypothetical protein
MGQVTDMIGELPDELIAVELKVSFNAKAFCQAHHNKSFATRSYVAVGVSPRQKSIQEMLGIGLLVVSPAGEVETRIEAVPCVPFAPRVTQLRERLALSDTGGVAGAPNTAGDGPAQSVARLVKPLRDAGVSWRECFKRVPNHYASHRSMQNVMMSYRPCREILCGPDPVDE